MSNDTSTHSAPARFLILITVGVAITLATGLVHGRLTQRWGPIPDLQAAARNLEEFPTKIGDWQFVSEEPMAEATRQMLSCAGYVNRHYVNRQSGQTVSIAIIVGPPGPIAVHTPEICYSSRAYSIHVPRRQVELLDGDGRTHSFWSLSFSPNSPSTDRLHVYYAWRSQDTWIASDSPRFEFAGERLLFKLQMASLVPSMTTEKTQDACQNFLVALLQSGWKVHVKDQ